MSSSIEDVLMTNNNNYKPQKKKHPILFIFFFLIFIALVGGFAYFYFFKTPIQNVDYTEDFFQFLSTNNSKTFLNDSLYSEILDKIEEQNYESNSDLTFSTTMKNEELNDIDISKLQVDINCISDKVIERNFFDINFSYLDNAIINAKLIDDKNEVYVTSDEIVNMYFGGEKTEFYPILSEVLNKDIDLNKIEDIRNALKNRIEYNDLSIPKYFSIIKENVPTGKIEKKENVIIQKEEDQNLNTTEYKLQLSQKEVNVILKKVLENLIKDDNLLSKISVEEAEEDFNQNPVQIQPNLNPVGENDNQEEISQETEENEQTLENQEENARSEENNTENPENENTVENNGIQVIENDDLSSNSLNNSENTVENNASLNENSESSNTIQNISIGNVVTKTNNENDNTLATNDVTKETKETDEYTVSEAFEIIKNAIIGKEKVSKENIINALTTLADEVDNLKGNGITASIYVNQNKIVKLSVELIDGVKIDLEFDQISEKENKMDLVYLKDEKTGFSVELYKNKKEAVTDFNILFSKIENKKVVQKIDIDTNLEGTVLSNSIKNSILVKYTDNSGEFKTNLNTEILFDSDKKLEEIDRSNFYDLVNAEQMYKESLTKQLKEAIDSTYKSKKDTIKVIENNTNSSEIKSREDEEDEDGQATIPNADRKEEIKNALVNKISSMMQEAQNNSQEFNLMSLKDLQIEGFNVSTIINSNLAIITIEGYTFNIDADFNLSEAQ